MNRLSHTMAIVVMIVALGLAACPSLWKHAQILTVRDGAEKVVGKMGGFKVHYPSGNSDKDDQQTYPEDHYMLAITNANIDDGIPTDKLDKISEIAVRSNESNQIVTGDKYLCDKSIDPANPGFGCRILSSKLGSLKTIYLQFKFPDQSYWTTDVIYLDNSTESSELGEDVNALMKGIASGKMESYTVKECKVDGKTVEVKESEPCPVAKPKPPDPKSCVAPNVFDAKTGKCISVVQPKLPCEGVGVQLLDGTCGKNCAVNQVQKLGKCECLSGFIKDAKATACIADPNLTPPIPPPTQAVGGGGNCSLIR